MKNKKPVAVSMDDTDKKAIEIVAQKTGLSFSAAVRMLIRFGIETWRLKETMTNGK